MNWFKIIICALVMSLCIMGIIYWHDNAGTYLSKFNNGCDNPFGQGKENCLHAQVWIYMAPYFFLVGIIGINIAVIWSTIKEEVYNG